VRAYPRRLISAVGLALHRLGRLGRPDHALRILYYHSISDAPIRSTVSPPDFAAQIEYLVESGHRLFALSDAVERLRSRTALPPRSVAVTLDDGFRDNYEHALPVLARLGVPATVFLTVAYIGTDSLPTLTRTDFMPRPLSWDQVREMRRRGIEFGSHTMTHPMLSRIPVAEARREIAEAKRRMEDVLGDPVSLFCYPRGDYDETVKRIVREEGYRAACATVPGLNGPESDRWALRRTYVSRRDTLGEFAKKIAGGYDLMQQVALWWHRLRRG
jgi:peptidoglycan/xylan/chitin deacetylase (PgdA/CDA1 family)